MDTENEDLQTAISEMVFDGWSDDEIKAEVARITKETREEMSARLPGDFSGN